MKPESSSQWKKSERFVQSIHGLCAAAEYSDEQTGKHILRVNEYSRFTASKLCMSSEFINTIGEVAAIHDIGKVAMPEIIKLPRGLTPEERAIIEMHTIYGAGILEQMIEIASIPDPRLIMAHEIALNHHQCWNCLWQRRETGCDRDARYLDGPSDDPQGPEPFVMFGEFGDSSLNLYARFFTTDVDQRIPLISDLHHRIYEKLAEEGITIAFPQLDVHFDAEPAKS